MNVSVFGLGYVGCVTAACLSRDGTRVIGVDVNPDKLAVIEAGRAPIREPGLDAMIRAAVEAGRLRVTADAAEAVRESDLSLVCVGTPGGPDGRLDLSQIRAVCSQIGRAVAAGGSPHTVVLRSTVPPGTTRSCADLLRAEAGAAPISAACNPEFLREGSAVSDYDSPPFTLIGSDDPAAESALRTLYAQIDAPLVVVRPDEAELAKAAANAWHAAKIVFANEIGRLSDGLGVDGRRVMELLRMDTKLNLSGAYLTPGFAYGGSCLGKDLRSLVAGAADTGVRLPLLSAVESSNHEHVEAAARRIKALRRTRIGVVGLAFKPGTDDLRESPTIALINRLMEHGMEVLIYDEAIRPEALLGANLRYAELHLPRLPDLLAPDWEALLSHAEVLVVAHAAEDLRARVDRSVPVVDLAGLHPSPPSTPNP